MSKRLTSLGVKGTPAMAGLLLTVLACMPMLGCLFPQDEDVIPRLPPKRNGAIQIVKPLEPRFVFKNTTLCPSQNRAFALTVTDEDVGDPVFSRWFIGGINTQAFGPSQLPGGSSVTRNVTAPSFLGFKSALANLATGTETLTVYVADTDFQEVIGGTIALVARPGPQLQLADGGIEVDKGSYDSFTWTLDVEPCS